MPRRTPTDRARERADRENLTALLLTLQRTHAARSGVRVPTKPSNDPDAVARLQSALMRYARKPPGTFMRDVRAYLAQPAPDESEG